MHPVHHPHPSHRRTPSASTTRPNPGNGKWFDASSAPSRADRSNSIRRDARASSGSISAPAHQVRLIHLHRRVRRVPQQQHRLPPLVSTNDTCPGVCPGVGSVTTCSVTAYSPRHEIDQPGIDQRVQHRRSITGRHRVRAGPGANSPTPTAAPHAARSETAAPAPPPGPPCSSPYGRNARCVNTTTSTASGDTPAATSTEAAPAPPPPAARQRPAPHPRVDQDRLAGTRDQPARVAQHHPPVLHQMLPVRREPRPDPPSGKK